jgi:hypothetical protein
MTVAEVRALVRPKMRAMPSKPVGVMPSVRSRPEPQRNPSRHFQSE